MFKQKFISRFRFHNFPSWLIQKLEAVQVELEPVSRSKREAKQNALWLILGYQLVLVHASISAKIKSFIHNPMWKQALFHGFDGDPPPFDIRVGWRNVLRQAQFHVHV